MPYERLRDFLCEQIGQIKAGGLFKGERVLSSPQQPHVAVQDGRSVLNLCANNYLGLANHPAVRQAARDALDRWGYGMASVRFICGTQELHKQLESALSRFLGTDDTILYSSCWDANGGLFETLLGPEDAVISDELNHASIIDGIRLCKAQRFRYRNNDMADLEARLQEVSRRPIPSDCHRRRLLHGRDHRQPGGDLRTGRSLRRLGHGGRFARGRISRSQRTRHARVLRRRGPHRHPHRHAGQGPGRRQRRLHQRAQRDHPVAASAVAALSVFQLAAAADRGGFAHGIGGVGRSRPSFANG